MTDSVNEKEAGCPADLNVEETDTSTKDAGSDSTPPLKNTPTKNRTASGEKRVITLLPTVTNMFKSPPPNLSAKDGKASTSGSSDILKATAALAAALKSEPKAKMFCSNTNCCQKTDTLFPASNHAKLYFGMRSSMTCMLCHDCFKRAEAFHQNSMKKLKNKENLFDLKVEIQTAEAVVDLDDDVEVVCNMDQDEGEATQEMTEEYEVDKRMLEKVLKQMVDKFACKQQLNICTESVESDVDNLAEQFSQLDSSLEKVRDEIDGLTNLFNDGFANKPFLADIGSVDISPHGGISVTEASQNKEFIESLGRIGEKQLKRHIQDLQNLQNLLPREISNSDKLIGTMTPPRHPPTTGFPGMNQTGPRKPGKLIFVKPKEGQDVYGMYRHKLWFWLPAKILKIQLSNTPNKPSIYTLQFHQRIKRPSKAANDLDQFIKECTGKEIAFKKPSTTVTLPVGTRVIARFKDLLKTDCDVDGCLYAGVIAEIPRELNQNRYLVFFDDGYAQYVSPSDVLPIVESSADVWQDVHENSAEFVQQYLQQFPNRHMIRAQVGSQFSVELNGNWLPARIVEVDASMLKMQYLRKPEVGSEFEWIYRGSTRLGPLYHRMKSLQSRPVAAYARRHTYSSRRSNYSFEMNQEDELVAKKHTYDNGSSGSAKNGGLVRTKNGLLINTKIESEGNMIKIKIPLECPTPKEYTPHQCSTKCAFVYKSDQLRRVSPLAVPFYLGWAREISGAKKDKLFYHTPCGIRLGTYEEIHNYIGRTRCEIPIDFFSLEANIDCLNEFEPLRKIEFLKDISYGKEWTPVTCVNSLDHDLPAYMEYITQRVAGPGVQINDEEEFLTCCDCTDDCTDKSKCACWQMTMSGVSFKIAKKEGIPLDGYENRRLKNHVLSGIYECNKRCKCRSTCFNRVVQNPVQWPIQMFKTVAKGWGVRAVHDMPQGSFICVYTGQLLTDEGANQSGREVGDEYLAELDFIECNEGIKEEYESDCTDIESEEPGTRTRQREERNEVIAESLKKSVVQVAKKATGGIQKAVKSTGGKKKFDEDGVNGTDSNEGSKSSGKFQVARKSGSKNGINAGQGDKNGGTATGSASSETSTVPVYDIDSDDEEDTNKVYSSFSASASAKDQKNAPRLPLREYFGKEEAVYIMDAKSMGNFGRYLNHSCDPNVFVQNLFVDTHDPRFPWVAFFTKKDVKAGTELTWDYNYDIGSVPGKTLYCYCFQSNCRGRLL